MVLLTIIKNMFPSLSTHAEIKLVDKLSTFRPLINAVLSPTMYSWTMYWIRIVCSHLSSTGVARLCDPAERYNCVTPTIANYVIRDIQSHCACAQQCDRFIYSYSLSQAIASEHSVAFTSEVTGGTPETVKQNFATVTIFFSEMSYDEIKTRKAYGVISLFCDIGGAFGLILGSTLLTVCEIVDFGFVHLWAYVFSKHKKMNQNMLQVRL